jgi:hypothetical protein
MAQHKEADDPEKCTNSCSALQLLGKTHAVSSCTMQSHNAGHSSNLPPAGAYHFTHTSRTPDYRHSRGLLWPHNSSAGHPCNSPAPASDTGSANQHGAVSLSLNTTVGPPTLQPACCYHAYTGAAPAAADYTSWEDGHVLQLLTGPRRSPCPRSHQSPSVQ